MILKKIFTIILILFITKSLTLTQETSLAKTTEKQCCEKSNVNKVTDCASKDKTSKSDKNKNCCNKEKAQKSDKTKTSCNKSTDCCMDKVDAKKVDQNQKLETKKGSDKKE